MPEILPEDTEEGAARQSAFRAGFGHGFDADSLTDQASRFWIGDRAEDPAPTAKVASTTA